MKKEGKTAPSPYPGGLVNGKILPGRLGMENGKRGSAHLRRL